MKGDQVAVNARALMAAADRLTRAGFDGLPVRLASRIEPDLHSGCWNWVGAINRGDGYGRICSRYDRQKHETAHRVVYETAVGAIPDGLDLDHLCRNRRCVNPAHLEPVTRQVNILRGETVTAANAKKTHCLHGHPLSGDNLRIKPNGRRECRTCARKRSSEYQKRPEYLARLRDRHAAKKAAS